MADLDRPSSFASLEMLIKGEDEDDNEGENEENIAGLAEPVAPASGLDPSVLEVGMEVSDGRIFHTPNDQPGIVGAECRRSPGQLGRKKPGENERRA